MRNVIDPDGETLPELEKIVATSVARWSVEIADGEITSETLLVALTTPLCAERPGELVPPALLADSATMIVWPASAPVSV